MTLWYGLTLAWLREMSKRPTKFDLAALRRKREEAEQFLAQFAQLEREAALKQGGKTAVNRRKFVLGGWLLDLVMTDEQAAAMFRRFIRDLSRAQDIAAFDDPAIIDAFPETKETLERHADALAAFRRGAKRRRTSKKAETKADKAPVAVAGNGGVIDGGG